MKKRDLYWIKEIGIFVLITLILGVIAVFGILRFNASYMAEEQEELQVSKKQIEWVILPFLQSRNFSKIRQYCNDFKNEDTEIRLFDENKKLLASSNVQNKTPLLERDSKILHHTYSRFKIYEYAIKNQKIGLREDYDINGHTYYLEITVSQADVLKSIINAQKNLAIFFIVYILFFIAGLIQVCYSLRNSFNKLEDSVIAVANGNLETEIDVPKIELLQELTIAIKKMVKRLKIQIARLTQLEQYKSEFLQNITHEIKTPITAINSAIELIEANNAIDNADKECFDIIQFQTKAIDKLVSDILSLSEIEVAKTDEHKDFKDFNLNDMIQNVIDEYNYSPVKINLISDEQIIAHGDKDLLQTAVSNLVSNALKYSKTDKIDIILNNHDNGIKVIVKDYGTGIEKQHLNHLFERFYRVDKARSRKLGGKGLGLAIVKNIVELHNGTIAVESEVGRGTTFICKFDKN
ncbi:MAG: ATP-binding protein [Cyanobacteriota bacterium]|nr:ATP-binding protein [Cyanobacteriota bacterium]